MWISSRPRDGGNFSQILLMFIHIKFWSLGSVDKKIVLRLIHSVRIGGVIIYLDYRSG